MEIFKLSKKPILVSEPKGIILSDISREVRRKVIKMIYQSKSSHLGSALSCVDILSALYFKILRIDVDNPSYGNRDRFILSKGHAAAALYAILAERGFFLEKELDDYCQDGKKLAGHSTKYSVPGAEVSTGSLGHGLSIGAGMAYAGKKDNKDYRVFVLMSDGECQEGSTWEAILFSGHHQLDNLIAVVDYNKWQAYGKISRILNLEPFAKKLKDFGWAVKEINGHNFSEIEKAFSQIPFKKGKPSLVLAHTIKGKGISFLENKLDSHYRVLSESEYNQTLSELD